MFISAVALLVLNCIRGRKIAGWNPAAIFPRTLVKLDKIKAKLGLWLIKCYVPTLIKSSKEGLTKVALTLTLRKVMLRK